MGNSGRCQVDFEQVGTVLVCTQQVICAVLLSITLATALIWDYIRAAVSSSGLTVVINAMTCRALHPL